MADSLMIYSDSGVGKTSVFISLSKMIYEEFGLFTRIVSIEGWEPLENEGLILNQTNKNGIIQAINVSARKFLLADLRKLVKGYWPKTVEEDVPILDENGIQTGTERKKVVRILEDAKQFDKIGLYIFETADGIADAFMRHIIKEETIEDTDKGPKVKSIGPQAASGRYEEDGEVFGGNSEGHYNIVQTELHNLAVASTGLQGNVKLVSWTSHIGTGKMKRSGEPCYCPLLVGDAKNAKVPSWFGDCFHLEHVPEIRDNDGNVLQNKVVKAFYESHRETGLMDGPQFLAKSRVGLTDIDALHEQFPGGYVELGTKDGEGLDRYYRWLRGRKGENQKNMRGWKEKVDAARKVST